VPRSDTEDRSEPEPKGRSTAAHGGTLSRIRVHANEAKGGVRFPSTLMSRVIAKGHRQAAGNQGNLSGKTAKLLT